MSEFQRNSTPTLPVDQSTKQRYNFRKHLACHKRKDFNSFCIFVLLRVLSETLLLKIRMKDRITDEIEKGRIQAAATSSFESLEISGINFDCGLNSDELGYISRSGIQDLLSTSQRPIEVTVHDSQTLIRTPLDPYLRRPVEFITSESSISLSMSDLHMDTS